MARPTPTKISRRSIYGLLLGGAGMLAALVLLHREVHRRPTSTTATTVASGRVTSASRITSPRPDTTRPELSEPMLPPSEDPWN